MSDSDKDSKGSDIDSKSKEKATELEVKVNDEAPEGPSKRRRIEGCQFLLDVANLGEQIGVLLLLPSAAFEDLYWTFFAIGIAFAIVGLIPNKWIKFGCSVMFEIVQGAVYLSVAPSDERGAGLIALVVILLVVQESIICYMAYLNHKLPDVKEKKPKKQILRTCCIKIWIFIPFNVLSTLLVYVEDNPTVQSSWLKVVITIQVFVSAVMNKLNESKTARKLYRKLRAQLLNEVAQETANALEGEETKFDHFMKIITWIIIIGGGIYVSAYLILVLALSIMGLQDQSEDSSAVDRGLFITMIIIICILICCIPCAFGVKKLKNKNGDSKNDKKSKCCCC